MYLKISPQLIIHRKSDPNKIKLPLVVPDNVYNENLRKEQEEKEIEIKLKEKRKGAREFKSYKKEENV